MPRKTAGDPHFPAWQIIEATLVTDPVELEAAERASRRRWQARKIAARILAICETQPQESERLLIQVTSLIAHEERLEVLETLLAQLAPERVLQLEEELKGRTGLEN